MDMIVNVTLSPASAKQVQAKLDDIAELESNRARLIASMNKPHLVAKRWIRMQLVRLFN